LGVIPVSGRGLGQRGQSTQGTAAREVMSMVEPRMFVLIYSIMGVRQANNTIRAMGGRPSKGTPADKRLSENKGKPKDPVTGKTTKTGK
jgi:hypothetical protein